MFALVHTGPTLDTVQDIDHCCDQDHCCYGSQCCDKGECCDTDQCCDKDQCCNEDQRCSEHHCTLARALIQRTFVRDLLLSRLAVSTLNQIDYIDTKVTSKLTTITCFQKLILD